MKKIKYIIFLLLSLLIIAIVYNNYTSVHDLDPRTWLIRSSEFPLEGNDTFWEKLPQRDEFFSVWDGTLDKSLDGTGLPDSPFLIKSAAQLAGFADIVNSGKNSSYTRLMTNIDLGSIEWNPIGNSRDMPKFNGFFDGNGYVIKNLKVTKASGAAGFFGVAESSCICNLIIEDAYIDAKNAVYSGILLGLNGGIVINSHSKGVVRGNDIVGGGIGENLWAEIVKHSGSSVDVLGESYIGGFIGMGTHPGIIVYCYARGVVSAKGRYSGGFIGNAYHYGGIPFISYSVASVDVIGKNCVGGFAGAAGYLTEIFDCYSTGNVEGGIRTGGFAGFNAGYICNSYSSGNTKGLDSVGGFIGENINVYNSQDAILDIVYTSNPPAFLKKLGKAISCGWLREDVSQNSKLPSIGKGLMNDESSNIKLFSDIKTLESNILMAARKCYDPLEYKASSMVYLKTGESKTLILDAGVNKPSITSVLPESVGKTSIIHLGNRIGILGSIENERYSELITVSYVTDSSQIFEKQFWLFIG